MGSFSNYLENKILNHILKVSSFSVPANIYVALSTTDPDDSGSGISEPADGAYARVLCNTWNTASARATKNTGAIQFAEAVNAWGNISHFALFDAITGGNMLGHGSFATPRYVGGGQIYTVYAEEMIISFNSGGVSNYLANALLNHTFKVSSFSVPTNIYVAVSLAAITEAMSGNSLSEPGGNYVRVNHNDWNTSVSGISDNDGAITFDQATSEWGRVISAALLSAATGGNLLIFADLSTALNIVTGSTLKFTDGSFDVTLD